MFLLSSNYWEFFENMSRVLNLKTGDWENPFFLLLITPPGGPIWDDIHSEGLCFNFLGSPFKSDDQKYSWSKFTTFRANSQESDKSLTFHEKDIFTLSSCIFPMVIGSILPHAEFGRNGHQEKTPNFSRSRMSIFEWKWSSSYFIFDAIHLVEISIKKFHMKNFFFLEIVSKDSSSW